MYRKLPPLNALRAFEAAGRHESFSRAAEELGVSHSSISRHVRGLEDRLGVHLFRDLPRGLALSKDGAAYLMDISQALDQIAEATEVLAEVPVGTITVNSEALFAQKWMMPRIGAFQEAHPDVEVRLETSRRLVDVERYEADLAIRFVRPGGSYPGAELLSVAGVFPYGAPKLFAQPISDPRELMGHHRFRDRNNDTWQRWFAQSGGVAPSEVPTTNWRLRSDLAMEATIAGQGVMLVSADVAAADVEKGRLVRVSDIGFQEGGFYLISREGALRRKAVRLFREWLLGETAIWREGAAPIINQKVE